MEVKLDQHPQVVQGYHFELAVHFVPAVDRWRMQDVQDAVELVKPDHRHWQPQCRSAFWNQLRSEVFVPKHLAERLLQPAGVVASRSGKMNCRQG